MTKFDDSQIIKEIEAFNAALAAADTLQEQKSIIQSEKVAMLKPTKLKSEKVSAEQARFEAEMEALNAALSNAKSEQQQTAILDAEKQRILG